MILNGDAIGMLKTLPDESVQCCVTSPPYWGLRDYGVPGQIGLEKTPEEYIAKMVEVFREVRRVLRGDGVLWLNLGDSYFGSWGNYGGQNRGRGSQREITNGSAVPNPAYGGLEKYRPPTAYAHDSLKAKDLVGIPWRVAFALQADGWWLRQDIIWAKPNPMPESVTDRCTKSHEYIFLLTKSARYYYDAEAVKEPIKDDTRNDRVDTGIFRPDRGYPGSASAGCGRLGSAEVRNLRSVWSITTKPFSGAHFATFPPEIPEICIKAGSRGGDTVLDPFAGSGTTLEVAKRLGRRFIGIELNPFYVHDLIIPRVENVDPLFGAGEQGETEK